MATAVPSYPLPTFSQLDTSSFLLLAADSWSGAWVLCCLLAAKGQCSGLSIGRPWQACVWVENTWEITPNTSISCGASPKQQTPNDTHSLPRVYLEVKRSENWKYKLVAQKELWI